MSGNNVLCAKVARGDGIGILWGFFVLFFFEFFWPLRLACGILVP